ncbi:MAG: hypothetical protein ACLP0B_23650, partial [Steroidobacteraceae bacterium]
MNPGRPAAAARLAKSSPACAKIPRDAAPLSHPSIAALPAFASAAASSSYSQKPEVTRRHQQGRDGRR